MCCVTFAVRWPVVYVGVIVYVVLCVLIEVCCVVVRCVLVVMDYVSCCLAHESFGMVHDVGCVM